ncbi:hypothetical protein [Streptomyces sp. NPDC093514]|uniref:hypothetical protein n=1 Tax=Streptomyces sp. NPDC093514 TaxID=3366039 RepID=UPI00380168B4
MSASTAGTVRETAIPTGAQVSCPPASSRMPFSAMTVVRTPWRPSSASTAAWARAP